MPAIVHRKLVRDRIPEIIRQSGSTCVTRILTQEEYVAALERKLQEELDEYQADKSLEELADLLEVLMAVAEARGASFAQVDALRREKAEQRGSFRERIFLESVSKGEEQHARHPL